MCVTPVTAIFCYLEIIGYFHLFSTFLYFVVTTKKYRCYTITKVLEKQKIFFQKMTRARTPYFSVLV